MRKSKRTVHRDPILKAKSRVFEISDQLSDSAIKAQRRFMGAEKKVVSYVNKNPLRSLGYSVLAGMILAKILRR